MESPDGRSPTWVLSPCTRPHTRTSHFSYTRIVYDPEESVSGDEDGGLTENAGVESGRGRALRDPPLVTVGRFVCRRPRVRERPGRALLRVTKISFRTRPPPKPPTKVSTFTNVKLESSSPFFFLEMSQSKQTKQVRFFRVTVSKDVLPLTASNRRGPKENLYQSKGSFMGFIGTELKNRNGGKISSPVNLT